MYYTWFNSTCYHPPARKTWPVWHGGQEFPQAVLPGGRRGGGGQIEITPRARTYGVTQWRRFLLASPLGMLANGWTRIIC